MDFPVTAEFARSANPIQVHDEARGTVQDWPATFVEQDDGTWVYRVDRDDVDADAVQAAIDAHVPQPTEAPAGPLERIAALEAEVRGMKDRAAAANVTNADAKAVRDAVAGTT